MTSLRSLSLSLLAILALTLPACGGGGGGGDEAGGVTPPEENLPGIADINPNPGSTDVEPDTVIEFIFQSDLDQNAIPVAAITVRDENGPLSGTVNYDAPRRALQFLPALLLDRGQQHTVTLAAGITDTDGNSRPNPFNFVFTTEELQNGTPVPHENEADHSMLVGFAINNTGKGASVVRTEVAFRTDLILRPYDSAFGFGAPIDIDSFVGDVTSDVDASVAVNGAGKGVAAWRLDTNSGDVFAVMFDAVAGTVDSVRSLETTTSASALPKVAIDQAGNAFVAWSQTAPGGTRQPWAASYVAGSGWNVAIDLEPTTNTTFTPSFSMSRTGDVVVAWTREDGNDYSVRARTWKPSGFGGIFSVGAQAGTQYIVREVISLDSGEATVLMTFANSGGSQVRGLRTRRYRPSTISNPGWQAIETPTALAGENTRFDIARINSITLVLVYGIEANTGTVLEARTFSGSSWSAPIDLTDVTLDSFENMSLNIVSRGDRYTMVDWGHNAAGVETRRAALLHNSNILYKDRVLPIDARTSVRGAIDVQGNARLVFKPRGSLDRLDLVEVAGNGTVSPAQRLDDQGADRLGNYLVQQRGNGIGAILFEERLGAVGTAYDVVQILLD